VSYDIERYLNVRSAYGATVGPEGESVGFLLDTTGVAQLWTMTGPGEWPEQRTFYEERVTFASYSPERQEIAFGMDDGGNERVQLFLLDPTTGEIDALTDMPEAKHRWGGWSSDGERFAFASNRRDRAVFDIYVQDRTERGAEATMIHEGDGWLSLGGWSPDDQQLLVHEARSSFDHELFVHDVETGELRQLTDHDDENRYSSVEWSPDGEAVYLVTDEDDDTLSLARLEVDSGEIETVRTGGKWNIDGVTLEEDSGRLVYSRNVDGYTELTAAELTGPTELEEYPTPDIPDGTAGGVSYFPNADRYALTVSGRSMNANVHVVDFETGETTRWTNAPTAGIPRASFREPELIHYESFDGRTIPAFFSLPEETEANSTPVVVDIHGGPESQRRPSFSAVTQHLLDHGYAVFEPNVRGSSGYGREYTHLDDVENRMDSVADVEAAVEWLHDHDAVDPDRIACKGGSYGGFMVLAAMAEYPDRWAAGVDSVGIANFVTFLENTGEWRRELREAEYGSLEDDREFLEEISPINNIESIDAPLYVLHGANDPRVPVGEAEQIVDEAREQGVPVRKRIFEDEGHGITKLENRIEAYSDIVDFLETHV
jgi:dipeptidyl aminopeptidase/acylaminoacyl peptidase